jgi:putative cardiolipin synthase
LFNTGEGAIQARVAMADVAQSSIDAQYFQWGRDHVGRVLIDRLLAAADRGVRVRILIDDYWTTGHDPAFQAIDAHPNIEIRVFNPFSRGRMRMTQILGRFTELNRRMHNKLFVADGQVAVVGGRNLHDEYFGMGEEICYRDFDLLAIGPVAQEAEEGFDRYWNSRWTYPISLLVEPAPQADLDQAYARFHAQVAAERATFPYALPNDQAAAMAWLEQFRGKVVWGKAELVYDDPNSVANPADAPPGMVWNKMAYLANHAEQELVLENAYFLPKPKMPAVHDLRQRGVRLRVLTNSLASTDDSLLTAIRTDPILRDVRLIAEPWDAGWAYQLGTEFPGALWHQWNGRFRDDVRRFVRGDPGMVGALMLRLYGSDDYNEAMGRHKAGDTVNVTVIRGDEKVTIPVTLTAIR